MCFILYVYDGRYAVYIYANLQHETIATATGNEKYIPLLKRTTAANYESRVAQVSGSRKKRLDKHLGLRESNERDGKQFFEHLRAQGNIDYG